MLSHKHGVPALFCVCQFIVQTIKDHWVMFYKKKKNSVMSLDNLCHFSAFSVAFHWLHSRINILPVLVYNSGTMHCPRSPEHGLSQRETYSTSTVYWYIASKLKVPLFFLPDIGGTTIQDVGCHLTVMRAGVHTMSDELILQISWAYTSNLVQYISGF